VLGQAGLHVLRTAAACGVDALATSYCMLHTMSVVYQEGHLAAPVCEVASGRLLAINGCMRVLQAPQPCTARAWVLSQRRAFEFVEG